VLRTPPLSLPDGRSVLVQPGTMPGEPGAGTGPTRGAVRLATRLRVLGVVLILVAGISFLLSRANDPDKVRCGSTVMQPGQTCTFVSRRGGDSDRDSYEERRAELARTHNAEVAVAAIAAPLGAVVLLGGFLLGSTARRGPSG
jgi:hypothetical protein